MAASPAGLDAHEQPSDEMRAEWKAVSRLDQHLVAEDPRIDDPRQPCAAGTTFRPAGRIDRRQLASAFEHLHPELAALADDHAPVLFHPLLPGLLIVPNLIPPPVQKSLLATMLHRDLSNPAHQTNMHLHYALPYPSLPPDGPSPSRSRSFFSLAPDSAPCFVPKDPGVHKPLTPRQVLDRRLHWLTLGGQYDWTNRAYPDQQPPKFPADLAGFLEELFPETQAQAAIVNFYSPGDTMMMHRDVSEDTDKGLVSLSFGCDCLFMIAPGGSPGQADGGGSCVAGPGGKQYLLLRLRSGDAVYMTAESRYAWHGVPKVIKGTCPDYLEDWPAENGQYAEWQGWMKNKRINLNVRQMTE